jgi:hypothetical protein
MLRKDSDYYPTILIKNLLNFHVKNRVMKKSMLISTFDSSPEMKTTDTLHQKQLSFAALPKHLCLMINAQWDPLTGHTFRSAQRWTYPGNYFQI